MVPFKERRSGEDRRSGNDRRQPSDSTAGSAGMKTTQSRGVATPKVPLKKDLSDVWNDKGKELLKLNAYDEAMKAFRMAVEIKPKHAEACYNLASVCSFKGEIDEALSRLKRAIEIDPGFKEKAKVNRYFKKLADKKEFRKLIE
ncbi:MAG: tetratricopeptide repeat protein [Deltaproteobacteria bacterium]